MRVAIVFGPDPDLGTDPNDEHHKVRSQGLFLDSANTDIILIYRQIGEQYEGGSRTHLVSSGIWENMDFEQLREILGIAGAL